MTLFFVRTCRYSILFLTILAAAGTGQAQTLDRTLFETISERISDPLVFSTRDTLFALSLPTDEPATIYLQLTVGRNGKVKEKQTKVHANHVAQYVAPAFVEATKGVRVDRALLGLVNKDTAVLIAFPLEYCHMLDTTINPSRADAYPYRSELSRKKMTTSLYNTDKSGGYFAERLQFQTILEDNPYFVNDPRFPKPQAVNGNVSFYIAFIQDDQE